MTSAAKARTGETPTARQKRVWDKSAPGYDKQIAFFEKIQFGGGREWLGERAHGRLLEIAIGTGRDAEFLEGDAEHLPSGDASFDTVVCALSLCTIPSPATAIGEMKRV